ncbi:hypothetical protein E0Z10_g7822 [Xylaria hypoxylon]|uniref:C2H2-type domain-containing protein n=1 Tax=Xylaria hypoxylon TaxID=37992 RepID=A0A4Z0YAM4_9PEZI|nr:hypothetical protein E0Z10_g7822 [Xylaria hypoxylon]
MDCVRGTMYSADKDKVLESSVAEFKKLQLPELFEKFKVTKLDDLKSKILEIQTSQERRKSMTDFSRILSFIRAFDSFAETFRLTSEQTACVWGPMKYILHVKPPFPPPNTLPTSSVLTVGQVVKDDNKALDEILQSYRGLGTRIPIVRPYTALVTQKPEVSICLAYMYQDLLEFQKSLLKLFSGHDWKQTFHTSWKYYHQDSFPDILKSFDHHHKALEELLRVHDYQTSIEHYQISSNMARQINSHLQNYQDDQQAVEEHIQRYKEDRKTLLENAKKQEEHRKEQQFEGFSKWVAAPTSTQESSHRNFADTRAKFPGTTDWIVENDNVENWINREPPEISILCLSGKKGAGKTILASQIIDHCREHRPEFKTSFFYCREDDPNQNNCLAIYKSLIIQMLVHYPDLIASCHEKKLRGNEMLNDEAIAQALIRLFCNADMNQFIIIDGVDEIETPQRKPLLQFFAGLVDKCDAYKPGKVRVMFLGHDLADYKQSKCMKSATIMQLDPKSIQKAITIFVAEKAKELKEKFGLTDQELQDAQTLTINQSDGMFLFASLAMGNLLSQPTTAYAKQQLLEEYFPQNLREARLRRDLGENQWIMAKKIFGWLACAKRPLNWHEIQAALSLVTNDFNTSVIMDYHNNQLRDDIRELCGSLVQKLGNRIMFIHSTAKLHIVETEQLDMKSIECDFTTTCLRYLSSPCFQRDLIEAQRESFTRQGHYSFQDYALAKWGHHLDAVIKAGPNLPDHNTDYLSQALSQFTSVYHSELLVPVDAEERIARAREECRDFANYDFYERLVTIWAHFSHHQTAHHKERNKLSLPSLATSLEQTRIMLESLSTQQGLRELYGDFLFKCNRLTCDFFYEGFESKDARDSHIKKHDRPYHCPVPGCSVVAFGFSTNKDREKHIRMYHPDESTASTFVQLPRELVEDARCERVEFQALLAQDKKAGFHILHHSQASYSRSLAKRCALCTLISSQLGEVEVGDDVCDYLKAFMVLKRRWPPVGNAVTGVKPFPVNIHSRLGFGTLSVMDTLPVQYQNSDYQGKAGHRSRKRKRNHTETSGSSEARPLEHNDHLDDPSPRDILSYHTGSCENMGLARRWIKDCLENHDMCASASIHSHVSFIPTRLIDTQDPKRPFLLTVTGVAGIEYIALSYSWGKGERFVTTQANFQDHQNCIPLEAAPKTFTHAFQITRELGYRYIWIDALCIIQNDKGDLDRELATMGEIYRHAIFTIFAEGAPDVFAGLFQKRDPYMYRPCAIDIKVTTDKGVMSEQVTLGTIVTGPNYLKERGWILQEEVLSSRCLLFGKQISWQCTASEASETRPVPRPRKTALTHGRATCEDKLRLWLYAPSKMGHTPREDWWRWNQYDAWYSVMEEYSIKSLSFATDQLPALSGLADLFQRAHHATYVAGLWREDLQLGLAWYVASNDPRPVKDTGDQKPSWSWPSVGMVRLKFRSWASFSTHMVSEGAEIVDASCTPLRQANPHGGVDDGILKLRTRIKRLRLCWSAQYVVNRTEFSYGSYSGTGTTTMTRGEHPRFPALVLDLESSDFVGEAALDRPIRARSGEGAENTDSFRISGEEVVKYTCEVWCALLHVQKTSDNLRFTALILNRDSAEPTIYRRLGLLFLDDQHVKDVSFSNWDTEVIDIL